MRRTPPRSAFFAGVRAGTAALALWALHFAFCYGAVAVGCSAILHDGAAVTPPQLRLLLAAATAAAVAAGLWLLYGACRSLAHAQGDLLPKVRLIGAALAVVAMLWTGLPLALLPLCRAA
jgi:hypothetical protein